MGGIQEGPRHVTMPAYQCWHCSRSFLRFSFWSCTQPPNVDDMLPHTFGNDHAGLVVVQVRDTLGLAEIDYRASLLFFSSLLNTVSILRITLHFE